MNILVTGGCGFIGTNYIRNILENTDWKVINLDLLTYAGRRENLSEYESLDRYTFVHGDICDAYLVNELVSEVDAIVHFAAESHVDRSIDDSHSFAVTNVIGTLTLLEAARLNGLKRFHHVSTDEVFGSLGEDGLFDDQTAYDPRSPYSASKASSDHFVRAYFHTHGLPITISNCSNNYGPYQYPEKFIPKAIKNILEGKQISVYGQGNNIRDWIYVDDHIEGINLVLKKGVPGETYCFGGETEISNLELARLICEIMENPTDLIEFVLDRKGHDYRYAIDNNRSKRDLSWQPESNFRERLTSTIDWYRNNPYFLTM